MKVRFFPALLVLACGNSNSSPDASDSFAADADPCAPSSTYLAEYAYFHSSFKDFAGIHEATVEESPGNTATTPPNGRISLCTPLEALLSFSKADHASVVHHVVPENFHQGVHSVIGFSNMDRDSLFNLTGTTATPNESAIIIEVRVGVNSTSIGTPVLGAQVSLNGSQTYVQNSELTFQSGSALTHSAYALIPGISTSTSHTVNIQAPTTYTCPQEIEIQPTGADMEQWTIYCFPNG